MLRSVRSEAGSAPTDSGSRSTTSVALSARYVDREETSTEVTDNDKSRICEKIRINPAATTGDEWLTVSVRWLKIP